MDTECIPALSPTRRNIQTTTKSFVDKRRPCQNVVPNRHMGNKLSFQRWINSIALSSPDHPSSIQNNWSIRSGFTALSPTSCVSRGASPEVRWSPPLLWKRHIQSLPDFPQELCSMASMWDFGKEQVLIPIYRKWKFLTKAAWQMVGKGRTTIYNIDLTPRRGIAWWTQWCLQIWMSIWINLHRNW